MPRTIHDFGGFPPELYKVRDAALAVPTPDHHLPLLYVIASRQQRDRVTFPVEGVDDGSISMLSVRVG